MCVTSLGLRRDILSLLSFLCLLTGHWGQSWSWGICVKDGRHEWLVEWTTHSPHIMGMSLHAKSLSHVRLSATLWTIARQAPLPMGFSRQEYWRGLPCPPPGDLSDPGIKPRLFTSPALAGRFFTTSTTWEALHSIYFLTKWPMTETVKSLWSEHLHYYLWNLSASSMSDFWSESEAEITPGNKPGFGLFGLFK